VLKGEYRGFDGILIAAHDNSGIVRLDSTKKLINIEVGSLASIPASEGSIAIIRESLFL
jgi:hypothetical protein